MPDFKPFLSFTDQLLADHKAKYPMPKYRKTELFYIDGTPWAETWVVGRPKAEWAVEKACEEFYCREDDVDWVDGTTDPVDYDGPDAGCDKLRIDGTIVGYIR